MPRCVDLRPTVFVVMILPDSVPESRWVHARPHVGGRIRDSSGHAWRIAEVLQSGIDLYTVRCAPRAHGLGVMPDLARDLLLRARQAASPIAYRGKRFRS
jgi:hypothetical protein